MRPDLPPALERLAILGTERAGAVSLALPIDTPSTTNEDRVLDAAAQLAPMRRAGYLPRTAHADSNTATPEVREPVSGRAGAMLAAVLAESKRPELLVDWCELALAAHCIAPAHRLPELMDAMLGWDPRTRIRLAAVVGERGRWLAVARREWSSLAPPAAPDPDRWQTGTFDERLTLLHTLRAQTPKEARALLETVREIEPPDAFARLLGLFEEGLSADDEHFLEGLLDARHKPIRTTAASLLGRLPQSAYCARMRDRLLALIGTEKRGKLAIALPPDPDKDKAWLRDGIDGKRQIGHIGRRGLMLAQLISATPLAALTAHTGLDPSRLAKAFAATDQARALLYGLVTAASVQRDRQWAAALAVTLEHCDDAARSEIGLEDEAHLIGLLAPAERETALATRLARAPGRWMGLLATGAAHPWSGRFTNSVLNASIASVRESAWLVNSLTGLIAVRAERAAAASAIERLRQLDDTWTPAWRELARVMELRLAYAEELAR